MPHAPFRLLRTTVVGATVMGLAAGAHLFAGGTLPAAPIMAALLALHILGTTAATQFRLALPAMAGLLAGSQLVLHQAFEALSHGAHLDTHAGALSGSAAGAAAHHTLSAEAHAAAMLAQAAADPSTPTLAAMGHGPMSGWMLAAHIGATLAAAVLLAHGENALWALAGWLRPLYRSAAVVLPVPAQPAHTRVLPPPLPRPPWRNLRPDTRRGPPRLPAFA